MELLQLKYFLILCESQHVSKTAEKLNISQPSLSSTIKKLEKEQADSPSLSTAFRL